MRDITHWTRQRSVSHGADSPRYPVSWLLRIVVFLLIFTPLVVFWPVHSHEFVLWDDDKHVFENPALRSITLDHFLSFWRAPYANLYIPFTYTLWALTAAVSRWVTPQPTGGTPLDPQIFHSLNLLGHLLNVLVVWRIVRLLLACTRREGQSPAPDHTQTQMEWAACGGALLFAVHPLQVEAVAWVSGFKDVLGGCLSFVAIWQYLQYASGGVDVVFSGKPSRGPARHLWIHYYFAVLVFVLALLAKPAAVVVPVVVWLLDIWGWPQTWRTRRPAILVWLVMALLWGVFTSRVQPATTVFFTVPLWARPLIAGDAVAFYLYKLFFPVWLGLDYGRTPEVVLAQSWLWLTHWVRAMGAGPLAVAQAGAGPLAGHRYGGGCSESPASAGIDPIWLPELFDSSRSLYVHCHAWTGAGPSVGTGAVAQTHAGRWLHCSPGGIGDT
jgi:hypothetical protein